MEFPDTSIVEQIEMKMIRPSQFAVRDNFQEALAFLRPAKNLHPAPFLVRFD
jgi:hypothetical protein